MSKCWYVGVDPGMSGALALLAGDKVLAVNEMPLLANKDIDASTLMGYLAHYKYLAHADKVSTLVFCCEAVQGDASFGGYRAVRFGDGFGSIKTCLRLQTDYLNPEYGKLECSLIFVRPQSWKAKLLPGIMGYKGKETYAQKKARQKKIACDFVTEKYPGVELRNKLASGKFSKTLNDNIAEACLIALFAQQAAL